MKYDSRIIKIVGCMSESEESEENQRPQLREYSNTLNSDRQEATSSRTNIPGQKQPKSDAVSTSAAMRSLTDINVFVAVTSARWSRQDKENLGFNSEGMSEKGLGRVIVIEIYVIVNDPLATGKTKSIVGGACRSNGKLELVPNWREHQRDIMTPGKSVNINGDERQRVWQQRLAKIAAVRATGEQNPFHGGKRNSVDTRSEKSRRPWVVSGTWVLPSLQTRLKNGRELLGEKNGVDHLDKDPPLALFLEHS
ncbi:hypothetical protein BD410DRAFT_807507 [Rickenella mellea]|uniref:Uncharacterized protein n=1 Tax=Rickenella mellea TaxID=50990 RepID=A0A4Y7PPS3_9AGAM|nr:hypothetical protein BD410DRAFT_807507 [Rickenella mellea]